MQAFRDAAAAVKSGEKAAEEASEELAQISSAFSIILKTANENAPAMGILIGLLTMILAYYAIICSNEGSSQAHADALAQLQATQQQTTAVQNDEKARQMTQDPLAKLRADVERLNALSAQQAAQRSPIAPTTRQRPRQKPAATGHPNRHERRKAARLAKKKR